jgi:hypothetical protein
MTGCPDTCNTSLTGEVKYAINNRESCRWIADHCSDQAGIVIASDRAQAQSMDSVAFQRAKERLKKLKEEGPQKKRPTWLRGEQ